MQIPFLQYMGYIPYMSSKKLSISNKIQLEALNIFNFIKWNSSTEWSEI